MGGMKKDEWIARYGLEHYRAHLKKSSERLKAKYANFTKEEKEAYLAARRPTHKNWYNKPSNKAKVVARAAITNKARRSTLEGRKSDNEVRMKSYYKAMADPERKTVLAKKAQERLKAWRIKNPEAHKIHTAATNARKRTTGEFNRHSWKAKLDAQDNKCFDCGEEKPLEVGHLVPVILGGTNDIDNLIGQCRQCNLAQGARPHHKHLVGAYSA